jgi:hypothetical protein
MHAVLKIARRAKQQGRTVVRDRAGLAGRLAAGVRGAEQAFLASAVSPATKIALRRYFLEVRAAVGEGRPVPALRDSGFRVLSQDDEDGILIFLLAVVGIGRRRFVDLGAGDCVMASNCANLALNLGFHGLFVDGDEARIQSGRAFYASSPDTSAFPPRTTHAFLTRENVNDVIRSAGIVGDIDVLSIDIDGNDYWIWEAIDCVTPKIVVIETHTEYRLHDVLAPYRPDFRWDDARAGEPLGASPVAMTRLAERLGYRLVGGNRYGFNAFYLQSGVAEELVPTVGVEELLQHDWSREPNPWSEPPPASTAVGD